MLPKRTNYRRKTISRLVEQFEMYGGHFPAISSIAVHCSFKSLNFNKDRITQALLMLDILTAQKCVLTKSTKSVTGLKVRKDMVTGAKVNLHGDAMFSFLMFFNQLVTPKIKFFTGFSAGQNGKSTTLMLTDPLATPELEAEYLRFKEMPKVAITINYKNNYYLMPVIMNAILSSMQTPFKA